MIMVGSVWGGVVSEYPVLIFTFIFLVGRDAIVCLVEAHTIFTSWDGLGSERAKT
jgi:hypothetical protein